MILSSPLPCSTPLGRAQYPGLALAEVPTYNMQWQNAYAQDDVPAIHPQLAEKGREATFRVS